MLTGHFTADIYQLIAVQLTYLMVGKAECNLVCRTIKNPLRTDNPTCHSLIAGPALQLMLIRLPEELTL